MNVGWDGWWLYLATTLVDANVGTHDHGFKDRILNDR